MAFTEKYIRIVITKNMCKRLAANHLRQLNRVYGHEHCPISVGIASSDHRICSLKFAAALMLTGLIFILRMTICLMTKLFRRNKDLYLLFSPRLSLILCCCFFVLRLSCFGYVFKMFLAVWLCQIS